MASERTQVMSKIALEYEYGKSNKEQGHHCDLALQPLNLNLIGVVPYHNNAPVPAPL